jgi:predicted nucleic acid-binding protein
VRILLDTNVLLDVLLEREPWREPAQAIWRASEEGQIRCYVTASSLTDVYYLSCAHIRRFGRPETDGRQIIRDCLDSLSILAVGRDDLERAYQLGGPDLEDDLQIACASHHSLDAIVTRDPGGFSGCSTPIYSPQEFLNHLGRPSASGDTSDLLDPEQRLGEPPEAQP